MKLVQKIAKYKTYLIALALTIVIAGTTVFLYLNFKNKPAPAIAQKPEVKKEYGLPIDSFYVENGAIEKNSYLGLLFNKYGIPYSSVETVLNITKNIFDIRKLKLGNIYKIFFDKKDKKTVHFFVYEENAVDYVVFDFKNTKVYKGKKPVRIEVKTTRGIIKSSLWVAMMDAKVSPLLSSELAEVYAWTINFFGLQTNDKFKVIYEERYVDNKSIGFGKIKAAWFEHSGKGIYAIPFHQDTTDSYFDENGNSLKRAFLKAPLKYTHIGSTFSPKRLDPIWKVYTTHYGVDYGAPAGTPVHSIGDGIVVRAHFDPMSGNMVTIQHNSIYTTAYLHLSSYAEGIRPGASVKQGQEIGYVGTTGHSTGPHLDFRVWKNGTPVDPLNLDAPPTDPVKPSNIPAFNRIKENWMKEINKIQF